MSAGRSAFDTDSLDCERLETSKDAVLMTAMPVFIIVVVTSVLHASISFLASSSFFFASLHLASTSWTAARSKPVPSLTAIVVLAAAFFGEAACFTPALALALALPLTFLPVESFGGPSSTIFASSWIRASSVTAGHRLPHTACIQSDLLGVSEGGSIFQAVAQSSMAAACCPSLDFAWPRVESARGLMGSRPKALLQSLAAPW
mmetsp:Transcript_62524/g.197417  ORF Transcript_62524/g.197417 Transcript_62524/m.197417 type:complete len:204 (-) Transcript_62524:769-1380(-)